MEAPKIPMEAPKIPARTKPTIAKTCPVSGANIIRPSSQCAALLVEDTNIQDKAAWKVSGWCSIGLKALRHEARIQNHFIF